MLEKGESINSQFHSTKLPGIIADAKSRAPSKFCDSTFLRIIFYIEKLNRHSSILFLSGVKVIYNGFCESSIRDRRDRWMKDVYHICDIRK